MKTTPNSVWLWPMAPVHFPTGSAYGLRERFVGTSHARQGVSSSRESLSPTTQRERDSSGVKNGETRTWSEGMREAAPTSRE